jgi:hypothetical protein
VGEQQEKATAGEVLMEEDNSGGIPWPDFASRCCGQVPGKGGRGDEALPLVWSESSKVAHQWWATTVETAASVEQSSKEHG